MFECLQFVQVGLQGDRHRRAQGVETEGAGGIYHNPNIHSTSVSRIASCWLV